MVSNWKEENATMKDRIVIRKKGQVTIPKAILEKFDMKEGDSFDIEINESGEIRLIPLIQVPASQQWFWTEKWQKEEAEAERDISEGNVKSFASLQDLFDDLDDSSS